MTCNPRTIYNFEVQTTSNIRFQAALPVATELSKITPDFFIKKNRKKTAKEN